jgi:hypothetical protein
MKKVSDFMYINPKLCSYNSYRFIQNCLCDISLTHRCFFSRRYSIGSVNMFDVAQHISVLTAVFTHETKKDF